MALRDYMNSHIVDIHTHKVAHGALSLTSYGVHPCYIEQASFPLTDSLFEEYDSVGEIGLDHRSVSSAERQRELFEEQLAIAERLSKIVVVHCVRAYQEVLNILVGYSLRCVIFHGFVGSVQLMRQITARGYYVSYGHRALSSPKTIEALRHTPLDRLFVESDESDESIEEIYSHIASLLGMAQGELIPIIYNNYTNILK